MQARLARSAYDALNISAGEVGPEHVRAAFLQLTKTFHPAKFARMAPDVQKLANEVFLGLRAAHDQLSRPRAAPPASVRQSQQLPFLGGSPKTPPETRPGTSPIRQPSTQIPRVNAPPTPTAAINPPTQPRANAQPAASSPTQPRLNVPPPPTAAINPPTQRGVSPAAAAARPASVARPGVRPGTPRAATPAGGVPIPGSGPRPAVTQPTPASGTPNAEPELAGVYDLLQKGQWEQARTTLNALIALQPRPRYRALLQYSLGREAQLSRRLDEARVELQGALEIDPDLQLAKTALAELFTRRK